MEYLGGDNIDFKTSKGGLKLLNKKNKQGRLSTKVIAVR